MLRWLSSSSASPFASASTSPYLQDSASLMPTAASVLPPNAADATAAAGSSSSRSAAGPAATPNSESSSASVLDSLLEPFKANALPLLARTDPAIKQRQPVPMTITKAWQYLPFLASQGTSLTKAFVNHYISGPPKPSWGVELTLFTSFLREAAAYSHLSSIHRLRSVLDLGSLLPTPKDGIVTPIAFRVKQRGLRGFLAEADAAESGKRQITAEWVINKRLWKRMQTEFAMHNVVRKDRVILYLHGGAYYMMSAETHRFLTVSVSRYTESRVFAINYRLAPETRFPGQLHDAVSAYMRLILDLKIPPENIVFAGDSAGAGLCVATMMYLRDEGYPLPSGAILMSPWVDLTMSCESWTTNQPFDYLPQPKTDDHLHPVKCLLGDQIDQYLCHPYVSPLFGDFTGLPPLLVQAGDAEVLRDEITLLAHKASLAGVSVDHEIFEDCVHVFQAFLFLEASRKAFQSQRHFVKVKLPMLNMPKKIDTATMDAEIAADAHKVDQEGRAGIESISLQTSPRESTSTIDLPATETVSDEDDEDDQLSDSSSHEAIVPNQEPDMAELPTLLETTAALASTVSTVLDQNAVLDQDGANGVDGTGSDLENGDGSTTKGRSTRPSAAALSFSPRRSNGRSSEYDTSVITPPPRPRLMSRGLTSARDLLMSRSNPTSPSASTHFIPNNSSTSSSSTSRPHLRAHSAHSASPVHLTFGNVHFETTETILDRPLHARSSSHPDLRTLIEEYEATGPANSTTVYSISGASTPDKL